MQRAVEFLSQTGGLAHQLLSRRRGRTTPPHPLLSRRREKATLSHPLLQDYADLTGREQKEVLCALSVLWEQHIAQGGDRVLLLCGTHDQAKYVSTLRRLADRVRQNGGQEKLHFALAAELMALYTELVSKPTLSLRDEALADCIAQHARHGSLIRRAGYGCTFHLQHG